MSIINRKNINESKWNALVDEMGKGFPYAYSWFLDIVATQWEAIVIGDYKAVLPLPYNRKWFGFKQLYAPFFTQQLGIIGNVNDHELISSIERIKSSYIKGNTNWMFDKTADLDRNTIAYKPRSNYEIHPNDYQSIQASYSKSLRKNLRKSADEIAVFSDITVKKIVQFYRMHVGSKAADLKDKDYSTIHTLIEAANVRKKLVLLVVRNKNNTVLAAGGFWKTKTRIVNCFSASSPEGNKLNAMSFMLDYLIQECANTNRIFDFEGSDLPSVQQYFKSFGAKNVPYPVLKW